MRLDLILAFLAVAEDRHFTRAAARLYLSQSGLSRRIAMLERLFGTSLVVRSARGVELTHAGAALLPHAERLVGAAADAAEAVAATRRTSMTDERPR